MTSFGQSTILASLIRTSLIAAMLCCAFPLQVNGNIPTIKYILPDIGTPGLAEVVEFIAPNSNSIGNFGTDGLYIPGSGGVEVQTGSSDIIPGPIVVSDNGRVLDAVIFVTPSANPSNQYFLNVKVNGVATGTTQQFYIVPVQHVGAMNSGGVIMGIVTVPGTPGRSARGAMIVDSMILSNNYVYTLDLNDHDGANNGNQAYLPATIYSLGRVMLSNGASLSIAANLRDAGPGGGGGGGRGCDYKSGYNNGGNGFTGGGGGGENGNPFLGQPNKYGTGGIGTLDSSIGLNSTHPGDGGKDLGPQGGAGGTGYPFGRGGVCWYSLLPGAPGGQAGGGSGGSDRHGGGGGGYSTPGGSADGANGGLAYGTPLVVPFCGGSGGAAGNPNAIIFGSGCGGDGGGGGGALLVYARDKIIVNGGCLINANGGTGTAGETSSPDGGGGGGSGGAVVLQSNVGVFISGQVSALGGTGGGGGGGGTSGGNGGDGRIRIDNIGGITDPSTAFQPGTIACGISLDTLSFTKTDTITIGGSISIPSVTTLVRITVQRADGTPQNDPGTGLPYFTAYLNIPPIERFQFSVRLDTSGGNTLFFISGIRIDVPPTGTVNSISSAAALIVRYRAPSCPTAKPTELDFGSVVNCDGTARKVMTDTVFVPKGATLSLRLAQGRSDLFTNIPPTLTGADTIYQPIIFVPKWGTNIMDYDTLIITDISNPSCPPIRVPLSGRNAQSVISTSPPSSTIVVTSTSSVAFEKYIATNSGWPAVVSQVFFDPPDGRFFINYPKPADLPQTLGITAPSDTLGIDFNFQPRNSGDTLPYTGWLKIYSRSLDPLCVSIDSVLIPITARVQSTGLALSTTLLKYGARTSCEDDTLSVTVKSIGNFPVRIDSVLLLPGSAALSYVLLPHKQPDSVKQGDSVIYRVSFHANAPDGFKASKLLVYYENQGLRCDTVTLIGNRVSAGLPAVLPIAFGSVNIGASRSDTAVIFNKGTSPLCVDLPSIHVDPPFTFTTSGTSPVQPGDTLKIIVNFSPAAGDTGKHSGWLTIISRCPCPETLMVAVSGSGGNGVPSYSPLQFGSVISCAQSTDSLSIWSGGNSVIHVDSLPRIVGPDAALFTIVGVPPYNVNLAPLPAKLTVVVHYDGTDSIDGPKSAQLMLLTTFNGKQDTTYIPLTATRVTKIATSISPVNFPTTFVGLQTLFIAIPIVNTGTAPITITAVNIIPLTSFSYSVSLPRVLQIGETLFVKVIFIPSPADTDSTRLVTALLIATTDDTCGNDTVRDVLTGRGYDTKPLPMRLCFPPTMSAPIGQRVDIPITVDTSVTIAGILTDSIFVSYDPVVLHILSASAACGTISIVDDPGKHQCLLRITNCTGKIVTGTFITLHCEVLIGDHNRGAMAVDSAKYSAATLLSVRCASDMQFTATAICSGNLANASGSNALAQNIPNPVTAFSPNATIEFESVADTRVVIRLFDIYGREVAHLVDAFMQHGKYATVFNTQGLPNGTYCYTIDEGIFHDAKRLVILR